VANFLRTVMVQNRAEAADRTVVEDLPVNPLSMILLTIRALKDGAAASQSGVVLLSHITDLAVSFRGQDIIRGSLQDIAMVNALVCGMPPWGYIQQGTDNDVASVTVPICFGRRPYMVTECFPAVRRGDLVLEMDIDAAVTGSNGLELQIETVELLDETPANYLKYTTSTRVFASTGAEDVRLPIGNPLLGVLFAGATVPTVESRTATWERLRLQVDNVEALYARCNWETLHGEMARRLVGPMDVLMGHIHQTDTTPDALSNSGQQTNPGGVTAAANAYGYMDFDPLMDGSFMLETAGRADVVVMRDEGTADAGRFIPVEWVAVRGSGS